MAKKKPQTKTPTKKIVKAAFVPTKSDSEIVNLCSQKLAATGLSIPKFAKQHKLPVVSLYAFFGRGSTPRLKVLEKILAALKLSVK